MHPQASSFSEIIKFNPYHDRLGRFSSAGGAASFTYKPGASTAHSKAIERERAKAGEDTDTGKGFKGTLYHGSPNTDIKEFDMSRAGQNTSSGEKLLFFTDSKQMAEDFSYERLEGSSKYLQQRGKKGRVYEVDVQMKNPLDLRKLSDKDVDNILKLDAEGLLTRSDIKRYAESNHQLLKAGLNLTADSLKELGYDGLIANTGKAGHNSLEYAVVDSRQAKIKKSFEVTDMAKSFSDILKFNPYHDSKGRFTSAGGASSMTIRTSSKLWQNAADKAIAREKERTANAAAAADTGKEKEVSIPKYLGETEKAVKLKMTVEDYDLETSRSRDVWIPKTQLSDDGIPGQWITEQKAQEFYQSGRRSPGSYGAYYSDAEGKKFNSSYTAKEKEYAKQRAESFKQGQNSYNELVQRAKDMGIKGVRVGMKRKTLEQKIRDAQAGVSKSYDDDLFQIVKSDEDKRLVFGWALVSATSDGQQIIDHQGDIVDQDELEEGAYEYVLNFRDAGEEHIGSLRKKARMVESVVFTEEKLKAMGIPLGTVPYGWWIGFYVDDDTTWERIKDGTYKMFSIEGRAIREPVNEPLTKSDSEYLAKSFSELIEKFNPYHDSRGRFTTAGAAASFTYKPGQGKMYDSAIAREKERTAAMANPGKEYGLNQEQHEKLERLVNGSPFSANKYRKEIGMSDEDFQKYKDKFYSSEKTRENRRKAEQEKRAEEQRQRDELDERVKQELPGLNQESIRRANDVSFFDHGSVAAREALRRVDDYKERNKITDDMTDEQKAYMQQREAEYKQLITEYYNDSNSRFANNPSWAITGPANYNSRRNDRLNNAARNKEQEYEEKLKRFEENTQRKLKSMETEEKQISYWRNGKYKYGEKIDPADPLAEKKYQAKIDYLKESNEKAKAANKYWNKNHDMSGFDGFSEETNQNLNSQFKRIYEGQIANRGLESVKSPFSTNTAEIRRNEQQLKQIQDRKSSTSSSSGSSGGGGNTTFNGGEIIRNTGLNRLQIKFDGVPDASVRQQLKSSGWRWSPSQGVWQRQLTDNAERSAKQITDELNKSYDGDVAKSFSEIIEKFNPYHDRLGRFTTGGGFMASGYTGDRDRQAVTFSADPNTRAGAMAISRASSSETGHEAIGRAYNNPDIPPKATTATKPQTNSKKPEKEQNEEETPRTKAIHDVENKIRNQNYESAAVIDDEGNQLLFKDGQASQVSFTRSEVMLMQNNTLTHNHPRCSMFSEEDLSSFARNMMYEVRATNRDGTTYSIRRADGGYSTDKALEFAQKYGKEYSKAISHAQNDLDNRGFQKKLARGEITSAEANIEFGRSSASYMSDYCSKNASKYGLVFSVEQTASSTKKSMRFNVMKADGKKGNDAFVLDKATNDLEDKAFNEWLERAMKSKNTAKSFSDVLTERSEQ